ncbi:hypothetical protein [Serratia sp. DD3]|uniref:hypothetical protein n=1 Tax=Serratia sp. DD3 TaxID=1410619 RepID=UPI0003C5216D|nr:hypothetical protein [Serratia sp. DD3]KEY60044.1 hypothetical protein SRDD_11540 [Serratia sp. DD3]
MSAFISRADFLKKIIELQQNCEALEETMVKSIIQAEINLLFREIDPELQRMDAESNLMDDAINAFKRTPRWRRLMFFYKQNSALGWVITIVHNCLLLVFLMILTGGTVTMDPGEQFILIDLVGVVMLILSTFLFLFYILHFFSRKVWIATYMKNNEPSVNQGS